MGKAEAVKSLAEKISEKEIDSINALVGITQAGKLNQIESLVTMCATLAKEMKDTREEMRKDSLGIKNVAFKMAEETASKLWVANEQIHKTLGYISQVARDIDVVANKPLYVQYIAAAAYAVIGATIMAGVLYFSFPSYDVLTKNQIAIYKAVEELKGAKAKPQGVK